MRKMPTILAFAFLAITLKRVRDFSVLYMHADWLGWPFSIGLGLTVFCASYFLRYKDARRAALTTLVIVAGLDGAFNLGEVLLSVIRQDLIGWGWAFGLSPTIIIGLLAWLQSKVDAIPQGQRKNSIIASARAWFAFQLRIPLNDAEDAPVHARIAVEDAQPPAALPAFIACKVPGCEAKFANAQARAAHMRWTHSKKSVV